MKVKVSLEGFIFPFLSRLIVFTPQSNFLLVFVVLLCLAEAFNKVDNISRVKVTLGVGGSQVHREF